MSCPFPAPPTRPPPSTMAGGWTVGRVVNLAELYDPSTGRFTPAAPMRERRSAHTATLLADGRVLTTGGTVQEGSALDTVEVFDPVTGKFTSVGRLTQARAALDTLELFDPASNTFQAAGRMTTPRNKLAGARLPSGRVLLLGGTRGYDRDTVLDSAEIYDPVSGQSQLTARSSWPGRAGPSCTTRHGAGLKLWPET